MIETTVLLVVHNCEMYIEECINSILCQTYKNFELLIIDDGSTDNTCNKVIQFDDKRIRLINSPYNDFIASLNTGLKQAKGRYIARMDGDDLMLPQRLEKQIEILNEREDIAICASWFQCFGLNNNIWDSYSGIICNPLVEMLKGNIVAHPTVVLRKSFFDGLNLFYKDYKYAEDYKLWTEVVMNGGKIWVIPEILLKYRCSSDQISYKKQEQQAETSFIIRNEVLAYLVEFYSRHDPSIVKLYENLLSYNEKDELSADLIIDVFYQIFNRKDFLDVSGTF